MHSTIFTTEHPYPELSAEVMATDDRDDHIEGGVSFGMPRKLIQ